MFDARPAEGERMRRVEEALEGATHEEIGQIAEALAAVVIAETPDINKAGRLFGVAATRSARLLREKSAS
jgi:hypothetical protein